jgi:uncharacterized protein with PIN domain/sulfur carrier protein ThiS
VALAHLRFYEELNDFLPPDRRRREFALRCAESATVKNAIESVGVPHTEVELILVNGESVDFGHRIREGDRISIYPMFEAFDVRPLLRVRPEPLREPRFIADAQLGGLARRLRMLGFDTLFDNPAADADIRRRALDEARTILTRDRQLLICRDVTHGCFVHALQPLEQLREVVDRLQLAGAARPFTRCLCCNSVLEAVDKTEVLDRLPPAVATGQTQFKRCPGCERVYWPGDHYKRMSAMLADVVARVQPGTLQPSPSRVAPGLPP